MFDKEESIKVWKFFFLWLELVLFKDGEEILIGDLKRFIRVYILVNVRIYNLYKIIIFRIFMLYYM